MDLTETEEGKRDRSLATGKMNEAEMEGWEQQRGQCDGEEGFPRVDERAAGDDCPLCGFLMSNVLPRLKGVNGD